MSDRKEFLESLIPPEERKLFGINEEMMELVEADQEENEIGPPTQKENDPDVLREEIYKFLDSQFKDLRDGMASIAEEFGADVIRELIDQLGYDEPTWQNRIILEAFGE